MTGTVIGLGKARKAKIKQVQAQTAQSNRAAFGRTKAQKALDRTEVDQTARTLDAARREPDPV